MKVVHSIKKELGLKKKLVLISTVMAVILVLFRFTSIPYYVFYPTDRFDTFCSPNGSSCVTLYYHRDFAFDSPILYTLSFNAWHYSPWWPPTNRIAFSPDISVAVNWVSDEKLKIEVGNGGDDYTVFGDLPDDIVLELSFNG
jgi:hypothetical protein